MAMMAKTSPALKRFFERIDYAPQPHDEALLRLFELWQQKRAGVTIPRMADFDVGALRPHARSAFIFERLLAGDRDYALRGTGEALGALLGTPAEGMTLKQASQPRNAVRFRRLFEVVQASGEPLLAQFMTDRAGDGPAVVELLVAPLSKDGHAVTAILGGISVRPVAQHVFKRLVEDRKDAHPLVFALGASEAFGRSAALHAGLDLSPYEERDFEDGEHKIRPLVPVAGREVHVIASLNGDETLSVNDRLCRLLFFIGALKTNGAARVTAITPYLCYLRKDRQTKAQDPLTARYVAQLFEALGTDRLVAMEAHNVAAFQNAFRIPTIHIEPYPAFADHLADRIGDADVVVVSPDLGGGKRADAFRAVLEARIGRPVGKAFAEKHRSMGVVSGDLFAGEVSGRKVVIVDDMISSGTTMARVAGECHARGAAEIYLAATHALFSADAAERLGQPHISGILIADTVQPLRIPAALRDRVTVVETAALIAEAMMTA